MLFLLQGVPHPLRGEGKGPLERAFCIGKLRGGRKEKSRRWRSSMFFAALPRNHAALPHSCPAGRRTSCGLGFPSGSAMVLSFAGPKERTKEKGLEGRTAFLVSPRI